MTQPYRRPVPPTVDRAARLISPINIGRMLRVRGWMAERLRYGQPVWVLEGLKPGWPHRFWAFSHWAVNEITADHSARVLLVVRPNRP